MQAGSVVEVWSPLQADGSSDIVLTEAWACITSFTE